MKLNWQKLFEIEKEQFDKMSNQDRFKYMLLIQKGSPYGWGKENPEKADCSGAVCLAIMAGLGKNIRTTANGLYKEIFTEKPNGIDAAFFITKREIKHGKRIVNAGHIIHVAGLVDPEVVLDMTPPMAKIRPLAEFKKIGKQMKCDVVIRGISSKNLNRHDGTLLFGVDEITKGLFQEGKYE